MTKCIAFHSYKGGTGKTTIAANLAVLLASKGYHVSLIELDVYAPSLHAYFEKEPIKWLNDFLWRNAEVDDVMMDLTPTIVINTSDNNNSSVKGRLYVGFCNPKKEEIYKLDGGTMQDISRIQLFRRFILLREQIVSNYDADYIIIDTSPGIRYWSINALAVADTLFLTLKMDNIDIDGTKKMADDIYSSFTNFGAKSYLVINKVAEYCTPSSGATTINVDATSSSSLGSSSSSSSYVSNSYYNKTLAVPQPEENDYDISGMSCKQLGMNTICAIPCYCDIQFSRREFLTVLKHPEHPFAKQIENLAEDKQIKVQYRRKEHD
jgi:MinD-like ATPase involved in chromosome partitioning or flagellar assembly